MGGSGGPGPSSAVLEAAPLVPLLVPDAAHGLDEGLVGIPLVPVAVLALLEDVLSAPVPGVLVAHPPAGDRGSSQQCPAGSSSPPPAGTSPPEREGSIPVPPQEPWQGWCLCVMLPGDTAPPPPSATTTQCHCTKAAAVEHGWETPMCWEGLEGPRLLQPCPAEPWGRARSCHTALVTLSGSLSVPAGQGKGGSGEGARRCDAHEQHLGDSCATCARQPCCHPGGTNHGVMGDLVRVSPLGPGATILTFRSGP